MGLATYLLIALLGTIHPLTGNIITTGINIIIRVFESSVVIVLPPAVDQGKRISRKILSRL
jgi:hypothetical protein